MQKISINNRLYPEKLKQLADPPRQLFVEGELTILDQKPMLAVVGSRKVSTYGQSVTKKLVREIASHGVVIISGLAFGVDSVAHNAALEVGGSTIAVLPSGLDNIYPKSHKNIADQIIKNGGLLMSEYPPKTDIFKHNFIARNRIVAGLSDAILISEAASRSGSLHTANFGLELGRDIFAVPGPITSENSAGCNNLIKSGAKPATEASDILDCFGISALDKQEIVAANEQEFKILSLIKAGTNDSELLQVMSGLSANDFQQTISLLEINGKISNPGGGQWVLK